MISAPPNPHQVKELGAYYTPAPIARFLVHWAVRSSHDSVLDPSFGGGVFLKAAADRIISLGGEVASSLFGIELDSVAHAAVSRVMTEFKLPRRNLWQADFFSSGEKLRGQLSAVIGNPPFIRYQQFKGAGKDRVSRLLAQEGIRLSDLASSWAPFVVFSASLLREGGRLAMVVPMELCHAGYAVPVLGYLARNFRSVQFISFSQSLFPNLSQDTLLLLADHRGGHEAEFRWKHFRDATSLGVAEPESSPLMRNSRILDTAAIAAGQQRLIEQFLPRKTRELYVRLRTHGSVRPLGAMADVGIGYVTGANGFFHLSPEEAKRWELPASHLRLTVCRGRAWDGLQFSSNELAAASASRAAALLLSVRAVELERLPASVQRYIRHGESLGVHHSYKCRVRSPWYSVPHVRRADAFLTYMSGASARLAVNATEAVAPNTLHLVQMLPLAGVGARELAVGWQSSLTELSAELEGHAMGGGMLKLEPSEAESVLVALPPGELSDSEFEELDNVSRRTSPENLRSLVDHMVLREGIGLSERDCRRLRQAAGLLRRRRMQRTYAPPSKAEIGVKENA